MNKDKVILISGANRGIGRKIADRLYQEGYQLSLGVRQLGCFKATLLDDPERVLVCHYEASDKQSPIDWIKATINRFGCLDGVINCAGILRKVQFEDDNEEALDELWEINVKAPMRLTREAFPYLRQSGEGRVINVISMSGKRVKGNLPTLAGYSMSKFAFLALSQSMRNVGWDDGIRVTAICPSYVNTDMARDLRVDPQTMTQPEDLAEIIATVLRLPNTAHISEILVNCSNE
jgi:NAD(P)-dependent dehydrogenase (short-subunit alcohol dehydrogenase family)